MSYKVYAAPIKNLKKNTQMLQSLVNRLTDQIDALYSELDSDGEGQ